MTLHKDEILDQLAQSANVAQFVAFRPRAADGCRQTFLRIAGHEPNHHFLDGGAAIDALLFSSGEGKVNVRSYLPDELRSREFVYGLETTEAALEVLDRLSAQGLHTIVNETIDVSDGGVSGVVQGDTMEFAPDDTPRCVEKPGIASFSFRHGMALLETVYGFRPDLTAGSDERTEFSIHPKPRGWKQTHTLVWEHERGVPRAETPELHWPNQFSRMIGDKAFGLLIADWIGVPVPRTWVIGRRVAPFAFGRSTRSSEVWTRTCPFEPQPGLYTTVKGWTDPFRLLCAEDPDGEVLASVLRQDAVQAAYSGAAIVDQLGNLLVEGRAGEGDRLMLGLDRPEPIPVSIERGVREVHERLAAILGPVRIEWVHDGQQVWVVQLHRGATQTAGSVVVPGEAEAWVEFNIEDGLEKLRDKLEVLREGQGIMLIGRVGVTSHIADLVRRSAKPARIALRT